MAIENILDNLNWTWIHTVACFVGGGLALAVMQMNGHIDRMLDYSKLATVAGRISNGMLGIALMWAANYPYTKGWQPWPPDVLVILTIDCCLLMRVIAIISRHIRAPFVWGKQDGIFGFGLEKVHGRKQSVS